MKDRPSTFKQGMDISLFSIRLHPVLFYLFDIVIILHDVANLMAYLLQVVTIRRLQETI